MRCAPSCSKRGLRADVQFVVTVDAFVGGPPSSESGFDLNEPEECGACFRHYTSCVCFVRWRKVPLGPSVKQSPYRPGRGGFRRERCPQTGWHLVTTESFSQGEAVLGMWQPTRSSDGAPTEREARAFAAGQWPSDAIVGNRWGCSYYDAAMPDLRPWRVGGVDEDDYLELSWRCSDEPPPAAVPDWYFLDHSSAPTVELPLRLPKVFSPDSWRYAPAPVWFAVADLPVGTVLTFKYPRPEPSWG